MKEKEFPYNKILVIDDSALDFLIATTIAKRLKPSVLLFHAMDVDEGLDMLMYFDPADVPDLILLDLNFGMQQKQGANFLREYDALPEACRAGTKTIVVVTAYAGFSGEHSFTKDLPPIKIIEKPLTEEKLLSI